MSSPRNLRTRDDPPFLPCSPPPLSIIYPFLLQMNGLLTLYLFPKSSSFVPKIILVVTLIGSPLLDTRFVAYQNLLLTPLGDIYGHHRSGLGYAHPFPSVLS